MNYPDEHEKESGTPLTPEQKQDMNLYRGIFAIQLKGSETVNRLINECNALIETLHPSNGDIDTWLDSVSNDPEIDNCYMEICRVQNMLETSVKNTDHEQAVVTLTQLADRMKEIVEQRKNSSQ